MDAEQLLAVEICREVGYQEFDPQGRPLRHVVLLVRDQMVALKRHKAMIGELASAVEYSGLRGPLIENMLKRARDLERI
jgi:hypothetical protein